MVQSMLPIFVKQQSQQRQSALVTFKQGFPRMQTHLSAFPGVLSYVRCLSDEPLYEMYIKIERKKNERKLRSSLGEEAKRKCFLLEAIAICYEERYNSS